MAIFLHYFDSASTFNEEYWGSGYTEPWVSYIDENEEVNYNKTEDEKLLGMPFTIEALGSGNIKWGLGKKTAQYSKNGGEWTAMSSATTIPVVAGDEVAFKGTNTSYSGCTFSVSTADFNVKGNIMSLTNGDNFLTASTLATSYTFESLFSGCGRLSSAGKLKLPATTLAYGCYDSMFYGCTSLTTAPELPATTLVGACYYFMFSGCTSLTTAPELPATTLAASCYYYMFADCTSLTTAPALPATTLAVGCYQYMFYGCTSLITAPELPATALTESCYRFMFAGCTSLATAPELPATALTNYCYNSMFNGCTSLTTAPELPATALAERCYWSMFTGCASLTTAPELLPALTLAANCYMQMFYGCTSLTTAPVLPATTLVTSCYANMFNGCSQLNYIKAMFTTAPQQSSSSYTFNWVNGVAASGTFIKNVAASWTVTGTYGVPSGWTIQTASA